MEIKRHFKWSVVLGLAAISCGSILLAQSPGLLADGVATRQLVTEVEVTLSKFAAAGFTDAAAKTAVKELTGIGVNPALAAQGVASVRSAEQASQLTQVLQSLSANAIAERRDMSWVVATALKRSFTYIPDSSLSAAIAGILSRQNTGATNDSDRQSVNIPVGTDEVEGVLALNEVASVHGALEALSAPGSDSRSARELVARTRKIGQTHCLTGAGISHGECVSKVTTAAVHMATNHKNVFVGSSKWQPLAWQVVKGFPGQTDAQGVPYTSAKNFGLVINGLVEHSSRTSLNPAFATECLMTGGAGAGTF